MFGRMLGCDLGVNPPFEKLVEALRPQRELSHSPLFQALFIFQNSPLGNATKAATEQEAGAMLAPVVETVAARNVRLVYGRAPTR